MSLIHVSKLKEADGFGKDPLIQCDVLRALEIPISEWRFTQPDMPNFVDARISGLALFLSSYDITPDFFVIPKGVITFPAKGVVMKKLRNFS